MGLYKLAPELWPKNRNRIIRLHAIGWSSGLIGGVLLSWMRSPYASLGTVISSFTTFAICVVIGCVLVTTFLVRNARQKYFSFELSVDEAGITRRQQGMTNVTIAGKEMTHVQKVEGHGCMVKTAVGSEFLWIPDELADYREVIALLSKWAPEEAPRTAMPLLLGPKMALIGGASLIVILFVKNPFVVTAVGVLYVGLILYQCVFVLRNPNFDKSNMTIMFIMNGITTLLIVVMVAAAWR